jgi:chemotaxis signal transduction protein
VTEHAQSSPGGSSQGTDATGDEAVSHFLVARVHELWMALAVEEVLEVVAYQVATPVPLAPRHILGLTKYRGQALPLVDLEVLLGLRTTDEGAASAHDGDLHCIVVVRAAGMTVGFPCHQVRGVVDSRLEPLGDAIQGQRVRELFSGQLPDSLVAVMDVPKLLAAARVAA